jgi:hypothetical protein
MWFLYVEWQIRRVPDTRLKPDGYEYEYKFLPVGMNINFYPQPLYWWVSNCSTQPKSDPLPSLAWISARRCSEEERRERVRVCDAASLTVSRPRHAAGSEPDKIAVL